MTTNTVKHTPDATDSIADDLLRNGYERWLRLEEEKAAIGDDLKELFAELKAHGFTPKALRESFRRVRNADSADQQEHDAIVDLYVASLTRARPARTREASYSEAKGRGFVATLTDEQMAAALAYDGEDSPVGVITDNQESDAGGCPPPHNSTSSADSLAPDESETDDVGATASSTNSIPQPTKGESDAKSAHDDSVFEEHLIDRRRQDAAKAERQQPIGHENAPVESAADTISTTNSNSQRPLAANSAGEAPSSSPASPARHSDDIDLTIPDFLRRTEGGYPKREAMEA